MTASSRGPENHDPRSTEPRDHEAQERIGLSQRRTVGCASWSCSRSVASRTSSSCSTTSGVPTRERAGHGGDDAGAVARGQLRGRSLRRRSPGRSLGGVLGRATRTGAALPRHRHRDRPGIGFALKLHQRPGRWPGAWSGSPGPTTRWSGATRTSTWPNSAPAQRSTCPPSTAPWTTRSTPATSPTGSWPSGGSPNPTSWPPPGGSRAPAVPPDAVAALTDRDHRPVPGRADARTAAGRGARGHRGAARADPGAAKAWRHAVRDVLGGLMGEGARVTGFVREGGYVVERRVGDEPPSYVRPGGAGIPPGPWIGKFPRGGPGQLVAELDALGCLKRAMRGPSAPAARRGRGPGARDRLDQRDHGVAPLLVGHADHRDVGDRGCSSSAASISAG